MSYCIIVIILSCPLITPETALQIEDGGIVCQQCAENCYRSPISSRVLC